MPYTLPLEHIARAKYRMRVSGKTRFHESLSNVWGREAELWVDQPDCPWNRRDREGTHPLITALAGFSGAISKSRPEAGKMPVWWNTIHAGDTEADWIRRETEGQERALVRTRKMLQSCIPHVDWSDWKEKDVEAALKALPVFAFESERHQVMMQLLDSGLPVGLLTYKDEPITPAMWSLIHHRYYNDIEFWVDRDLPLDPPGNGPGVLGALLLMHNSFPKETNIVALAEKMVLKGASVTRPACTKEWQPESSIRHLLPDELHLFHRTIAGQAQALGNPGLVSVLVKHPHASDEARIESARTLMEQHGQQERNRRYDQKKEQKDFITPLWEVLNYNAVDPKVWKANSKMLAEKFITDVWGNGALFVNPLTIKCWKQLLSFMGDELAPISRRALMDGVGNVVHSVPPARLREVLNLDGFLSDVPMPRQEVIFYCVLSLVEKSLSYEGEGRQDKIRGMVDYLLSQEPLSADESQNRKLTEQLMSLSDGGISLPNLSFLIASLEKGGWKPTSEGWEKLHERIHKYEPDNADIIVMLACIMGKHQVPVNEGRFLIAPYGRAQAENRSLGYGSQCEWTAETARLAHNAFVEAALQCIENFNTVPWGERGTRSLLHGISKQMLVATQLPDCEESKAYFESLDHLVNELISKGADPLQEPKSTDPKATHWIDELERDHPFMNNWSDRIHQHLDASTNASTARPKSRRF